MDASLRKSDFLQVVAATQVLQKSCGLFVLATLTSLGGLASLFCLNTLARLTTLAKVARFDKPQLFGALLWQLSSVKNTLSDADTLSRLT